jgi:putative endonuclease
MPCYLLHFSEYLGTPDNPRGRAKHYLGSTDRSIDIRLQEHRSGRGAKITAAAVRKGIELRLVRVWADGDREFEIWLKEAHNSPKYCPICNPSIDLRIKKLMLIKELEKQIQEQGAIEVIAALCDALEVKGEIALSDQIREILFCNRSVIDNGNSIGAAAL